MSTTVIMVIGGIGFFVAMSLMRWTLRQSRRERPEGIRWRGIDWSRGRQDEEAADAGEAKADAPDDRDATS